MSKTGKILIALLVAIYIIASVSAKPFNTDDLQTTDYESESAINYDSDVSTSDAAKKPIFKWNCKVKRYKEGEPEEKVDQQLRELRDNLEN
ncbi:8682_t:CDS:2 [Scutellospora calospora]|uniref:8682_t:CDS:1 n=1 Tax=Scutellospora calospora TaxID=85575 RepID=A0ACA9KQC8_9GLOM|nr:8682_t:CDS:2 [Scutellospora calospora]